jgi:hypothetical protein
MRKLELTWQSQLVLAFMIAASAALTLALACAAPLAAFAAVFALILNRRDAVLFTGAAWLANQAVGFAFLSYPMSANSLSWGLALGIASIAAALAAHSCAAYFEKISKAALPVIAFIAAFAVYEFALYAAAVTFLGATEDFTLSIIGWVFETNAIATVLLLLGTRLRVSFGAGEATGSSTI